MNEIISHKPAMITPWERIQFVMRYSKIIWASNLASELGLKRAENLYQIKRSNNGISKKLAETIVGRYPDFSESWLLTGKGEPFVKDCCPKGFYNVLYYANFTSSHIEAHSPDYILPILDNSSPAVDYATTLKSDCLEPRIPAGSTILLKEDHRIIYGQRYYIELNNGRSLYRIIRKSERPCFVRLLAENPHYDDIEIAEEEITALFAIVGYIAYF